MSSVFSKISRTTLTATEKFELRDTVDIPIIAGPGAMTTIIVLMNDAKTMAPIAIGILMAIIAISIVLTYYMMRNSDYILTRIGQREYRAINRLMGLLPIAIAVQFVINGIRLAFPLLSGG